MPRREDNKPKTIDQIHQEAVAEQQKTVAMLRVQSTPAMLDQRGRHRQNPVDNWKSPVNAVDPSRIRVSRQPADDNIQLGPGSGRAGYSHWQCSGGAGSRTASTDRDQQLR